jgi:hypothetical protein
MRRRFLEGKPETGDAEDISYRPTFIFRPATKHTARLSVVSIKFAGSGAWQATANAAIDKMVKDAVAEAHLDDDQKPNPSEDYYVELKISLPFATPNFLSVHARYSNYLGQAHENRWETNINIDTSAGRELTFDNSVDPGKANELFQSCRSQILHEKSEGADIHGLDDDQANDVDLQEVIEGTKQLSSWAFSKSQIVIDYGDYAFGGYGKCMCSCTVPYSNMGAAARQNLRLP